MSSQPLLSPIERYRQDLARGHSADPAQAVVMDYLQGIYFALQGGGAGGGWWARLWTRRPPEVRGLYVWGGVGRGKTYLMDTFYDCLDGLADVPRRRVHFHHFMKGLHQQLRDLPKSPNPLPIIARRIAAECRVLCLDEFFVDDVADAMLLVGLLPPLFQHGVVLVTTSNTNPDRLYENGLQRLHFLKAIDEIKSHTHVVELELGTDYRLQLLERSGTYHVVTDAEPDWLASQFERLVPSHERVEGALIVNDRVIATRARSLDTAWFDFAALCATPRSSSDYVDLAQAYTCILLGPVPVMGEAKEDVAKRFMHLIDALYDHGVKLILTAHAPPEQLYTGRLIQHPFQRTVSRLHEMGSAAYLHRAHTV